MRSFLTSIPNSRFSVVFLVPCLLLLICSACATSFPLDNLEVGMTMVQATEAFGEPSSTNAKELSEAVQLLQKENDRIYNRLESAVDLSETRGPVARELEQSSTETLRSLEELLVELDEARGEQAQGVKSAWVYPHEEVLWGWVAFYAIPFVGWVAASPPSNHIDRQEVDLRFEGNKLASWETRPAPSVPTTGTYYVYQNPFPPMTFPTKVPTKDAKHHAKGHKHHHGH